MANIDLGNLTRYDGKIKQYAENKYLSKNTANWQMTEKAGAVTCYPVPDTELEPIVDFSFKEIPPVSGDKSPTNPSTITGISSIAITRCEAIDVDETQYTVNLDSTYYGGSVNLATGLMTVTWKGKSFDGTENWQLASNVITGYKVFYYTGFYMDGTTEISALTQTCTHYLLKGDLQTASNHFYLSNNHTWFVSTEQSVDDFKAFLVQQNSLGTPVTIICKTNPYVIQLDPIQIKSLTALDKNTPRLNTLYTDADSIQVGYQKHPARTAYELENAILALGGGE